MTGQSLFAKWNGRRRRQVEVTLNDLMQLTR